MAEKTYTIDTPEDKEVLSKLFEMGMELEAIKKHLDKGFSLQDILLIARNTSEKGIPFNTKLVRADYVDYAPPRWLIKPLIQKGKGTLIQGDNGSGKTAFAMGIAAAVSTGKPILNTKVLDPGNVLILSVEDEMSVLRGRIEASGGDLTRCFFMDESENLSFNDPEVEAAITDIDAKLVIFDPFQNFLGNVDMFRANETRPEMMRLFSMCDKHDCACVIIAHTGKSSNDKSPVNRSLGSVDIPATMRSIIHVAKNPANEKECLAFHVKCSSAQRERTISYTIGDRGGVQWLGYNHLNIQDLSNKMAKNLGIPFDEEPFVDFFEYHLAVMPEGGFIAYSDIPNLSTEYLGYPVVGSSQEVRERLTDAFLDELAERKGIIVVLGVKSAGQRGLKIRAKPGFNVQS